MLDHMHKLSIFSCALSTFFHFFDFSHEKTFCVTSYATRNDHNNVNLGGYPEHDTDELDDSLFLYFMGMHNNSSLLPISQLKQV